MPTRGEKSEGAGRERRRDQAPQQTRVTVVIRWTRSPLAAARDGWWSICWTSRRCTPPTAGPLRGGRCRPTFVLLLRQRRSVLYPVASLGVEVEEEEAVAALPLDNTVVAPLGGGRQPPALLPTGRQQRGTPVAAARV